MRTKILMLIPRKKQGHQNSFFGRCSNDLYLTLNRSLTLG